MLLTSLLPKATINRLRHEIDWEDLKGTKHDLNLVEIGKRDGIESGERWVCGPWCDAHAHPL